MKQCEYICIITNNWSGHSTFTYGNNTVTNVPIKKCG